MNDKKILKIATSLNAIGIFDKSKNPTDVYRALQGIAGKQKDYFAIFEPNDFIKLSITCYFIKNGYSFEQIQSVFQRLFFATIIESSGDKYDAECEECGGNGTETCPECDNGRVECEECDGDGTFTCSTCDGDGKVLDDEGNEIECDECDGEGTVECYECQGAGTVSCSNCGGSEEIECDECSGDGVYETDDNIYDEYFICSWDKDLQNLCEMNEGTPRPISTDDDFAKFEPNLIYLYSGEEHVEFNSNFMFDNFYCVIYFGDSPELMIYNQIIRPKRGTRSHDLSNLTL